jgi:hypothetical protein
VQRLLEAPQSIGFDTERAAPGQAIERLVHPGRLGLSHPARDDQGDQSGDQQPVPDTQIGPPPEQLDEHRRGEEAEREPHVMGADPPLWSPQRQVDDGGLL